MEAAWLWRKEETAGQRALLAPLRGAEAAWAAGAWLHRKMYDTGLWRRVRLGARVVSVGNLAVGGSAKTPVVGWLAAELRARGYKVAVLSRGVGGRVGRGVCVVSDGERVLAGPEEAGDEPLWLAGHVPGVPVLAGRSRVALGLRAQSVFGAELLILDDGFQHHRLARDLDLVCLDAELGTGNGHQIPRGPLREPPSALRRADALLWTRVEAGDPRRPELAMPQFRVHVEPSGLRALGRGGFQPLEALRGRAVGVVAAIARPDRLVRRLERLGARVEQVRRFPDHHRYTRDEIAALDPSRTWVTTAKDAVKIPPAWAGATGVHVLEEEVRVVEGPRMLEWMLERLEVTP